MRNKLAASMSLMSCFQRIGPSADPLPAADQTVRSDTRTWAPAVTGASFQQVQTTARASGRVAQYCAPADEDFDAPRVYCRSEPA